MLSDRCLGRLDDEKGSYEAVPDNEAEFEYIEKGSQRSSRADVFSARDNRQTDRLHIYYALSILNLTLFVASLALFVTWSNRESELNYALKRISAYSPVLESAKIPLVEQQVHGKLFPSSDGSDLLGRFEPGPETDKLWWADFEWQRAFAISGEQVRKLGKDPQKTVKFPPELGLGDDAYFAQLDVFHQAHCLNALREEVFKDYYFDGEHYHEEMYDENITHRRVHSELWWVHMRHCTDILLQSLMCNGGTEMITMTWMEGENMPWPDMSVNKKCVDFDALKKWRDDNALDWDKVEQLVKPYNQTKNQDAFWALNRDDTHPGDNVHHPSGNWFST